MSPCFRDSVYSWRLAHEGVEIKAKNLVLLKGLVKSHIYLKAGDYLFYDDKVISFILTVV